MQGVGEGGQAQRQGGELACAQQSTRHHTSLCVRRSCGCSTPTRRCCNNREPAIGLHGRGLVFEQEQRALRPV